MLWEQARKMPDTTDSHAEVSREDGGQLIDFPRGSKPPPENNLPLQLTSFIGREREISDLEKLLTADCDDDAPGKAKA